MIAIRESTARQVLRLLAGGGEISLPESVDAQAIERWVTSRDLGPLAYERLRRVEPSLGARFQPDAMAAVAENALLRSLMVELVRLLNRLDTPVMALKGFAAASYYGGFDWRTMSDIDLLAPAGLAEALPAVVEAGLRPVPASPKTPAGQQWPFNVHGAIGIAKPGFRGARLDLHTVPFPGYWQSYCARFDHAGMWQRREKLELEEKVELFRPEINDLLLHTMSHIAVNHQFNDLSLRSLMDVLLLARTGLVDWETVTSRAVRWRVATATWLALDLVHAIFDLEEAGIAARKLAPSPLKQRVLHAFVPADEVMTSGQAGAWRRTPLRFLFLAALIDGRRRRMGMDT